MPTPLRIPQTSGHSSFHVSNLPLWSLKSPSSQWLKLSFFICSRVSARFLHCFCTVSRDAMGTLTCKIRQRVQKLPGEKSRCFAQKRRKLESFKIRVPRLRGSFNQRARDSSSLERAKIQRRIVRFLVGFSIFWGSTHFLHTFCTPAGKPCFSLHCLHSVHREQSLSGRGPSISPAARPFCRLKAPLGLSLLRCARKREFSILFSGEQQAGELTPLLGVHLSDNFQHPFRGDLDAVRQIFFYRHRAGFGGTDVL